MGDSSESEEFYDAEEFTPVKGSKRSSMCKNINVLETCKVTSDKKSSSSSPTAPVALEVPEVDRNTVKNVVEDRRRFEELRRSMQTEEDDETPTGHPSSLQHHTFSMEHPFKIIEHDTMSMQSMTSLGRIGRILSGAAETHPNIRENKSVSNETSSTGDISEQRQHNLAMAEPDVIASTKANSLKANRGVTVTCSANTRVQPVAPPRRRKKNKLHGSQTLSTTDGDNFSIYTSDTDDFRQEKPPPLTLEPSFSDILCQNALPSPASTIESLTRELQDSLELSQTKYDSKDSRSESTDSCHVSSSGSLSKASVATNAKNIDLDITGAIKGEYVVRAQDELVLRSGRSGSITTRDSRQAVGHSSLDSNTRVCNDGRSRRRSAGDAAVVLTADTDTCSLAGRQSTQIPQLSDMQILEQVTVLNLDTGERVPLSVAEHKLPQCINPLSLHIMRLTSEYIGRTNDDENTSVRCRSLCQRVSIRVRGHYRMARVTTTPVYRALSHTTLSPSRPSWRTRLTNRFHSTFSVNNLGVQHATSDISITAHRETDEESETVGIGAGAEEEATVAAQPQATSTSLRRKTDKLKRFLGSTVKKTVDVAKSLAQEVSHARHKEDVADIADDVTGEHNIKLKASNSHKGPYDFDGCVRYVQEMSGEHTGAVWCSKFSVCGRLLATAGQDKLLRVWVTRDARDMFHEMRSKYSSTPSPCCSHESLNSPSPSPAAAFCPQPFAVYQGHTSDLLDVSWSKNYFILSSSMDKTVRLWHISRSECLCCFQHIDFVTAIVFHPRDDCYFLSGSLDGKLRLWNIPDKKVAVWNEVQGKSKLITAANFCQNGKFAVVGTYDGRCIFYTTDQLKYHTQIDVRSTRGKNSTGRKISGIEPMPNDDKILVTSNDSRIRLYDLRDLNLSCKYKGYVNVSSQIKASFSHDGKYIVSGSENQCIYIWKTYHDYSKFTSVRRDRNDFWEGIKAHNAVVTCAVFAPNPEHMIKVITERERELNKNDQEAQIKDESSMVSSSQSGHVLVSADFNGCIKVFVHRAKPKHSSLPASALA